MHHSNDPIDHFVNDLLSTFNHDEYGALLDRVPRRELLIKPPPRNPFMEAYTYIENLPFEELPKWVGHPSGNIKEIVARRFAGRSDFRYEDWTGDRISDG